MLIKWALESRKRRNDPSTVPHHITLIGTQSSAKPAKLTKDDSLPDSISSSMSSGDGREKFYKEAAIAKTTETEDASRHRRAEQEERAMFLRDDRLLSVAQDPRLNRHHSNEGEHHAASLRPSHALTKENVESYNEKAVHDNSVEEATSGSDPMRDLLGQKLASKPPSDAKTAMRTRSEDVITKRPPLPQRSDRWESERTVTKQ